MITHYAQVQLATVSIEGATQVYGDRLGFPVVEETDSSVTFRAAPFALLTFVERYERIAPAHLAFQVPYSTFPASADLIRRSGVLTARPPRGGEVIEEDEGAFRRRRLYFRDGDGNLLEIIARSDVAEDVLPAQPPLHVLFLREVGFPVERVSAFCGWLESRLGMVPLGAIDEAITFVAGGTALAVVAVKSRPWIPIAMRALPPPLEVVLGTPDRGFLDRLRGGEHGEHLGTTVPGAAVRLEREGYGFCVRHEPRFPLDLPSRLGLRPPRRSG
jgi:catechol 2,3-dioxygenase-like lactoylglutathione lyase family enzyme